jgi:chromosome segregation ATPase
MDSPVITAEKQLLADIDQLRNQFPNTQELYREVCTVLFFRYGITPTANKLYQYVKKGSMSAPAEALAKFWDTLREKSRVRIEHPDLPEEIKDRAGELAAALWDLAQDKAKASLQAFEAEARAAVIEAKDAQASAEAQRDTASVQHDRVQAELMQAKDQISMLQQQLAAEKTARDMLEEQLAQAQDDIAAHRQANESARHYFAAEIDKLRGEAQLAEERSRSAEKRALLEIDRERSAAGKLQKELDAARSEAARAAEQHRIDIAALQQQLGDVRQQSGKLEGQLQAAKTHSEHLLVDYQEEQKRAAEAALRAASLESERNGWRIRAEDAETAVHDLKEQVAILRSRRNIRAAQAKS